MRSTAIIAVLATAILMSSCDWLTAQRQQRQQALLSGTWTLDSADSKYPDSAYQFWGLSKKEVDSSFRHSQLTLRFFADSVVVSGPRNLNDSLKFMLKNGDLIIDDSSATPVSLHVVELKDSLLSLSGDSLSFVFKRRQ